MSAILEFLNAFSAAPLTAFLNTLWLAFAAAAAIWLAFRLMPRVNAATRHAVWWAVLAMVVILPFAGILYRPAPSMPSPAQAEMQAPVLGPSALKHLAVTRTDSAVMLAPAALNPLHSSSAGSSYVHFPIEIHTGNWESGLLFLWLALTCVLLGRIVRSYLHLRSLRNRARPAGAQLMFRLVHLQRESRTSCKPQLLVSDEVISPLAAGFLHPVIVLPAALLAEISDPELDYVLLHELAHVARRDNWTNLMGRLVSAGFVLHPVAMWVLHRIEREREIACDDWVVAATGSAVRYAATLARMFEFCCRRRRELLATGMAHRSSNLRERIEMLLQPRLHFSRGASLRRVSFCVAACIAFLSFGLRMPGWIASAEDSTVAVASHHTDQQSQIPGAAIAIVSGASPIAPPMNSETLSPEYRAQSSATPSETSAEQEKTWRHEWKLTRDGSSTSKVQLSLVSRDDDGTDRMNNEDVALSSLTGFSLSVLDHDGPVKFEYVRNAGRILCEGNVTEGRAAGSFTVALNPSFVSALQGMGYAAPHDDEAFSLVTSDVTLGYARNIRDTGLTSSISDLIDLQDHGVSADYVRDVRQEGFTNLTASDISDLRDHGVAPSYLKEIKAVGPNLSINAIDSLYDHGVKPDYYKSMTATAPQLSIEQIDSLFDHGVQPDSYKGFASVEPDLSIEQINSLCDHGVKPGYYASVRSVDPNMSIENIDSLYDHGVQPDSYKGFASVGPKLSIEEIDSLYDHGVKPDSYEEFASVDPQLSIDEINSLRDHGVEPDFYRGIKAADSRISIEEVDQLRDHGVEPDYLKEIRALPDGFSISDIAELRDHGISASYIRKLHDMGMKTLTAAQIVHLREGD